MTYRDLNNGGWGTVRREWVSELVCGIARVGRYVGNLAGRVLSVKPGRWGL